jgi:transcriptional regulator with XRE-family HTH domain
MDVLERFIEDAKSRRGRLDEIAAASGVSPKALRNIRYGATLDPRISTVRKLEAYYAQQGSGLSGTAQSGRRTA